MILFCLSRNRRISHTMMNTMEINGYRAVIAYDPDIEMFRGEFTGLNGGADFYAKDIEVQKNEGALSLNVFLDITMSIKNLLALKPVTTPSF